MTHEATQTQRGSVPMAYRLGWCVRRTAVHTLNRLVVRL